MTTEIHAKLLTERACIAISWPSRNTYKGILMTEAQLFPKRITMDQDALVVASGRTESLRILAYQLQSALC